MKPSKDTVLPSTPSHIPLPNSSDIEWRFFKEGNFNQTFLGFLNHWWILKLPKNSNSVNIEMSHPQRFVRKNALINQHKLPVSLESGYDVKLELPPSDIPPNTIYLYLHPTSQQLSVKFQDKESVSCENLIENSFSPILVHALKTALSLGHISKVLKNELIDQLKLSREKLIMPYVGRHIPPDRLREEYVLDIYRQTRNIIIDACIPGNLIMYEDEIVCVDFDCATSRDSETSIRFLKHLKTENEPHLFLNRNIQRDCNPLTAEMCLNLLYLENHLPAEQIHNQFLTKPIMQVIQHFRKMKFNLREGHLEKIKLITDNMTDFPRYLEMITPYFLSQIKPETTDIQHQIMRLFKLLKSESSVSKTSKIGIFSPSEGSPKPPSNSKFIPKITK